MPTAYETPAVPFADLSTRLLEASTRAITASADLYTDVVRSQADATASLLGAYLGVGAQAAGTGRQTVEVAEETTAKVARSTARATRRATKRTAGATRKAARTAVNAPAKAAAEAPVSGYDDLTADELVAKLPELSQAQLAQVAAYERAHAARSTVLERVAALTGSEPVPGYDELTADDAQKLVSGGDAELAATVRDYERRHKGRSSVIDAAVRNADAS